MMINIAPNSESNRHLHRQMRSLLLALDYNFEHFSLADFVRWIEAQQNERRIALVPRSLPPSLSGAWLTGEACDYVFYEENTLALHQLHIQLHELSHILCGHPGLTIGIAINAPQTPEGQDPNRLTTYLLRSHHSHRAEQEAELLASLIQMRSLRSTYVDDGNTLSRADILCDLLYLRHWLENMRPLIALNCLSGWETQEDLDLYIYRALIDILDLRKKLAACTDFPRFIPDGTALLSQPGAALVQQQDPLQMLLALKGDSKYSELVSGCCQISRQVRSMRDTVL